MAGGFAHDFLNAINGVPPPPPPFVVTYGGLMHRSRMVSTPHSSIDFKIYVLHNVILTRYYLPKRMRRRGCWFSASYYRFSVGWPFPTKHIDLSTICEKVPPSAKTPLQSVKRSHPLPKHHVSPSIHRLTNQCAWLGRASRQKIGNMTPKTAHDTDSGCVLEDNKELKLHYVKHRF